MVPLCTKQGVYGAIGSVDERQVVPILGGSSKFCKRPVGSLAREVVNEAELGPYMEGVRRIGGVFVSGRIFAVNIAKIRRIVGIT